MTDNELLIKNEIENLVEDPNNQGRAARVIDLIASRQQEHLDLADLGITSDVMDIVAQGLAANKTLTNLNVSGNDIGDDGARDLAANTILTTLDVIENHIGTEGIQAFTGNTTLTNLDVSGNHVNDVGARAVATNTTLTDLDITDLNIGENNIGTAGAQDLASITGDTRNEATRSIDTMLSRNRRLVSEQ